jgi:hypothetical protein
MDDVCDDDDVDDDDYDDDDKVSQVPVKSIWWNLTQKHIFCVKFKSTVSSWKNIIEICELSHYQQVSQNMRLI